MAVIHLGNNFYQGLSGDTKPTNVPDNSSFYETDTFTFWRMVSGTWKELSQVQSNLDYIIYISGSKYKAKNMRTGVVDYVDTTPDVGALTNTVLTAVSSTGATIGYTRDLFTIHTPIALLKGTTSGVKPCGFIGNIDTNIRDTATQFKIGSSFPDQRYMFESISSPGSNTTSKVKIANFAFVNNSFAKDGNGTTNINTTATRIDAGIIKFESDGNNGLGSPLFIENIYTQYLWRGIHLLGYMYWPVIQNCNFTDSNIHFVGDFDIQLEKGNDSHSDMVKCAHIVNCRAAHTAGLVGSGGRGSMNASLNLGGGYHFVNNYFVDGNKYNDCVIGFKRLFSSVLNRIGTIDLTPTVETPGTFKGVFLFDTTDPGGITATSNYSTFNNQITNIYGSPTPYTLAFRNGPFRNIITLYAYWGNLATIDDSGAGIENVIELIDGQQPSATANTKITSTNSLVKIIDKRANAVNSGIKTSSGDGSTKVFTQNHGLYTTPSNYYVHPLTTDAVGSFDVSVSSSQITITYPIAPPSGTNNLKWSWYGGVYQ